MQKQKTNYNEEQKRSSNSFAYQGTYKTGNIYSCTFDKADLVRLFSELEEKGKEGLEYQLMKLKSPDNLQPEDFVDLKEKIRQGYRLTMFIYVVNEEQIIVNNIESLKNQNLPEQISQVTYDSAINSKNINNFEPINRFRIILDFTEPPGFDKYNPNNSPTPNMSKYEIIGQNSTWVKGVYQYMIEFFNIRKKKRSWLHSHNFYNIYQWIFAIPASLWIVYRISFIFKSFFENLHGTLTGAIYIYVFLLTFLFMRIIIYGFRWLFPLIELSESRSKKYEL